MLLVFKKLFLGKKKCWFGKKLKKHFFAQKNPKNALWGKLENEVLFKKFFQAFFIDKTSISQCNPKQALSKLLLFCYAFKYPILTLFESFIYYTCSVLFQITNSLEASRTFGPHQVN